MSDAAFAQIDQLKTNGPQAVLDGLIQQLEQAGDLHKLFDALLMKTKHEMGLSVLRPTSFDDVPEDKKEAFEEAYIAAARRVGEALLAAGNIPQAWMYLRTIREPQKIVAAIENLSPQGPVDEQVLEIALFQGIAPAKGVELMLAAHGTCSTITALDQQMQQLPAHDRRQCAAKMVARLYTDLRETLQAEVRKRQPMLPPGQSVKDLIAGRDWLFENENYHIDVSHLNAVVRMARALQPGDVELQQASQLALYGSRLAPQYQYGGTPPFAEFYPAHRHFFRVLLDEDRTGGLQYFRDKLQATSEDSERILTALTLVDLYQRIGQNDAAVELAREHLVTGAEEVGFSLGDLLLQSGRLDLYRDLARDKGDVVAYASAVVEQSG